MPAKARRRRGEDLQNLRGLAASWEFFRVPLGRTAAPEIPHCRGLTSINLHQGLAVCGFRNSPGVAAALTLRRIEGIIAADLR